MNANQMFLLNYNPINYFLHSNAPWFHSWYRPISKIAMKITLVVDQVIKLLLFFDIIIGNISAISTSKIKKIIAIKKKFNEKGRREELKGSNPHSKGEFFSRSLIIFFDNKVARIITITEIVIISKIIEEIK